MAKTKSGVDDQTKYGERIAALEENIGAVDEARVKLEERVEHLESFEDLTKRVEKLEARMQRMELLYEKNVNGGVAEGERDSMGLPKVV